MDAMKSGRRLVSDRLPELDLLRFIAAFSVLLFHHIRWAESLDGTVLFQISRFGFFGVPLFFMISGFVILWSAQGKDLLEFAVSRITRLYPTFWICVCLAAIAELSLGNHVTPFRFLANLTMIPTSFGATKMDGVYWTLFYELKFYVFVALLISVRQLPNIDRWLAGWLIATALTPMGPIWVTSITLAPWSAFFIGGCNLFLIWSRGWNGWRAAGLVGAFFLSLSAGMNSQESGVQVPSDALQAFAIVVIYAMMATLALRWWRLPHTSLWLTLGSFTFPLYLVHSRPARALWNAIDLPDVPRLLIVSGASLAVAAVLAYAIERRACGRLNRALLKLFRPTTAGQTTPVSKTAKRA